MPARHSSRLATTNITVTSPASATDPHVSRDVSACDGTVIANAERHEEREPDPQPRRVDRHRALAGAVHAVEQLVHLVHPRRTRTRRS